MTRLLPLAAVLLCAGACSTPSRKPAVPVDAQDRAAIVEFHGIRTWADKLDQPFLEELKAASAREIADRRGGAESTAVPVAHYLAISGGGANGAYGAGVLCGWTETGTRPEFKVVTGISTGALTAPFAFLGPAHDETLRRVYTTLRTKDVVKERNILAGLIGDALADYTPLKRLIAQVVDEQLLQAIAAEHHRGRILLIGTTNLDAQRGVVWNVTAIAASGHTQALRLVHQILLASSAIPAAFPPVMIDVEADGRRFQEMHVDGGALSQVFFYPPSVQLTSEKTGVDRARKVYVVRNARLSPQWEEVERSTLKIASRAIDSLILTQGLGDLYRMYLTSMRDDVDFNLTYIPETFRDVPREPFDPVYTTALFEVGRAAVLNGSAWSKSPPGFALPDTRRAPTLVPATKEGS
jgi:predicted acylesterase/phospholipase RssA